MTRTHGRCPRGERLVARTPFGRWRTLTFLAALRCDRLTAPCVIDGPINGVSFRAYVEQVLVPTLNPGDIVVMDNLASHKGRAVRASHPRRQSQALFLARLLARSQSHRTGLRQNEDLAPQSRRPNNRQDLANHRRPPRLLHPHRMPQLLQKRRICFSLTRSRSRACVQLKRERIGIGRGTLCVSGGVRDELSPIFGDGLKDQAAVWDCRSPGLAMTSYPS